ncbi:MAG: hypothetical protein IJ565_04520 [Bacilli bacterium]|nr:hypothetical protein [Bacilli bacterium]
MKKLIPFRKEITFDSNLYEVTSISLENTLHKEGNIVLGDFIVSGEYRVTETSINTLPFNYNIPFTIDIDEIYDIDNASIDIDDFYYEIVNNKILVVNIEVKLDHVEEILLERKDMNIDDNKIDDIDLDVTLDNINTDINDNSVDIDINNISIDNDDIIISNIDEVEPKDLKKSLFANLDSSDNYVSYRVYIIRENDNLDNIMAKYNVTRDMLDQYNDLNNIKLGDKIIIPYVKS